MQIRKVLLVDDEEDIRTIAELALGEVGGWEVVLAESGPQAIERAASEQPDLILLDVMMPGMDGPSTYGQLKQRDDTSGIPVIFMTAKVQAEEVARYKALGARGVIAKPFDPMSLPDEIRRIVTA